MSKPGLRKRATGRITLQDVATLAGVSPITVSRALRGERAVDPALTDRSWTCSKPCSAACARRATRR